MKAASNRTFAPRGYQLAKLYLPTPADPGNVFYKAPETICVKLPANRRKAPRRGVFVPPLVPDVRGFHLRMARRVAKLIKAGLVQPEVRVPKQRPPMSKRQMRQEWIEASVEDANTIARERRERRQAQHQSGGVA